MSNERVQSDERATDREDEQSVDEGPEMQASRQRERDHRPDEYTVGYDPFGETRVGIGSANGDINRLIRHNEGRHQSDGDHSSREAARDKKRITQSLCSALDVTQYRQGRAVSAMSEMNLDRFGQQKRIEKVALCTIAVVVDKDRERYFLDGKLPAELDLSTVEPDDFPTKLTEQSKFRSLCEQHELSKKDRYSVSQLVKRELKRIEFFERANQPIQ